MKIRAYQSFKRAYSELPAKIQTKVDKQIKLLSENMNHPSLHTKKIKGKEGIKTFELTFELTILDQDDQAHYNRFEDKKDDSL